MQARGQQAPLVTIPGEADAVAVKNHVPCVEVSVRNLLRFQEQHRLEDLFAVPAPRYIMIIILICRTKSYMRFISLAWNIQIW